MLACYNCKKFLFRSIECESCVRPLPGGGWHAAAYEELEKPEVFFSAPSFTSTSKTNERKMEK